jgi:hypothetical protein
VTGPDVGSLAPPALVPTAPAVHGPARAGRTVEVAVPIAAVGSLPERLGDVRLAVTIRSLDDADAVTGEPLLVGVSVTLLELRAAIPLPERAGRYSVSLSLVDARGAPVDVLGGAIPELTLEVSDPVELGGVD